MSERKEIGERGPESTSKSFGTTVESRSRSQSAKEQLRRRLKSLRYNGRQARKKPFISARNKKKRMNWARQKKGCVFVWRKLTEEWLPCCTLGTVKTGEPSLTVWSCMSHDAGVGPLTIVYIMAVSLVQSTVVFWINTSCHQLQTDDAGAKLLFCKITTHQSIEPEW